MREKQRLKELVKRIQHDDPEATEEIILTFDPKLKSYSRHLGYEDAYADLVVWIVSSIKTCPLEKSEDVQVLNSKDLLRLKKIFKQGVVKMAVTGLHHEYIRLGKKRKRLVENELLILNEHLSEYAADRSEEIVDKLTAEEEKFEDIIIALQRDFKKTLDNSLFMRYSSYRGPGWMAIHRCCFRVLKNGKGTVQ